MRLAYQFQGKTVKGQDYRQAGAYRVGRTRRPHFLFVYVLCSTMISLFLLLPEVDIDDILLHPVVWFVLLNSMRRI